MKRNFLFSNYFVDERACHIIALIVEIYVINGARASFINKYSRFRYIFSQYGRSMKPITVCVRDDFIAVRYQELISRAHIWER